jgi:hypothetical protein
MLVEGPQIADPLSECALEMAEIGADLAPARMIEVGRQPEPNWPTMIPLPNIIDGFIQQI